MDPIKLVDGCPHCKDAKASFRATHHRPTKQFPVHNTIWTCDKCDCDIVIIVRQKAWTHGDLFGSGKSFNDLFEIERSLPESVRVKEPDAQ
ncbi:MAG: hypothetical protein LBQ12_14510 [Deltaproteobacteria bacterium]|jgi:hypothetical protein|nr:hypothetical protein [Deltaproteobacteria bacterium]